MKVKETLETHSIKWKIQDPKELQFMIKKCLIEELWKLEDRKKIIREVKERNRRM